MADRVRKPEWLKINIGANDRYTETKRIVDSHCLHTICSSGRCPNMGECWGKGTATFMIGGDICTRSCKFCNTQTGRPASTGCQRTDTRSGVYRSYETRSCGSYFGRP